MQGDPSQRSATPVSTASSESAALARAITRAEGGVTFGLIRWLVAPSRRDDAFRAYAYFRWVDDHLDTGDTGRPIRLAFLARQEALVDAGLRGRTPSPSTPEERMLVDLVDGDKPPQSSLARYVQSMLQVMRFDSSRQGRTISRHELAEYTRGLSLGVISALDCFLGPEDRSTVLPAQLAVAGAHIAHMLRDTTDDLRLGYYNIPREVLSASDLRPDQIGSPAYRAWVQRRADLARRAIRCGKAYVLAARNFRFRLACLVYVLRFEVLLDAIRDGNYEVDRSFPSPGKAEAAALLARACLQALPVLPDVRGTFVDPRPSHRRQAPRQAQ